MARHLLRIALGLLVAGTMARGLALAGEPMVNTDVQGHAIHGYDPVAYFTDGKAEKGNPAYSYEWKHAVWLFASAANRDKFKAAPAKYAPQFGGYCAYAVGNNHVANGDPNVWSIVNGKLYLNLSKGVQERWQADRPALIAAALNNWPGVLGSQFGQEGGGKAGR